MSISMGRTAAMAKTEMRSEILARRDALDPQWRIEASLEMASFADGIAFTAGTVISGFWPMRSEVDVRPLMDVLRRKGARMTLPAILSPTQMIFREFVPGAPVIDMGFKTYGPDENATELDPEILLVPIVGFDGRGQRLGYGAGYYDRAIEKLHNKGITPRLIGIAFNAQRVDIMPNEAHDVPLTEILTETGLHVLPLQN